MDFVRSEIAKGRQVYIIFPLIEESSKLDYENLMKGYENVRAYFPNPNIGSAWCMASKRLCKSKPI